jgi:hypothetical protein
LAVVIRITKIRYRAQGIERRPQGVICITGQDKQDAQPTIGTQAKRQKGEQMNTEEMTTKKMSGEIMSTEEIDAEANIKEGTGAEQVNLTGRVFKLREHRWRVLAHHGLDVVMAVSEDKNYPCGELIFLFNVDICKNEMSCSRLQWYGITGRRLFEILDEIRNGYMEKGFLHYKRIKPVDMRDDDAADAALWGYLHRIPDVCRRLMIQAYKEERGFAKDSIAGKISLPCC